ncbi:hypothetical protein RJ639_023845 [Escallonia herrerae]|uniref:Pectinesterase n=1 Tax=Escallonia herrerae TaxID=1293975 RepID=A0AA89AFI3_9ASTE|nr:hypothetical protein RJ639_023845 [Escallonia herrerae]
MTFITAQAMDNGTSNSGFSFLHCNVTGTGGHAYLGRLGGLLQRNLFYGEYDCSGPGSDVSRRVGFAKKLSDADAKPFLSLSFVEGSKWLLPPASL